MSNTFGFDFSADDIRTVARLVEWYRSCSKAEYLSVLDAATADRKFHKHEECFRCLRKPGWRSSDTKLSFESTVKLLESQL